MEIIKQISVEDILAVMRKKGYVIYENDSKEFNLNLVGVRSNNIKANSFDDKLYVFWKFHGQWNLKEYQITTDPGNYYLEHLLSPLGTAILKPGQYIGMWMIGLHRGKYKALVQNKPCTVLRDSNKDHILDFNTKKEETGNFGIDLHRAVDHAVTNEVGPHSAGCQVFKNSNDFDGFMDLAEKARSNFGNSFTYTLLIENDF